MSSPNIRSILARPWLLGAAGAGSIVAGIAAATVLPHLWMIPLVGLAVGLAIVGMGSARPEVPRDRSRARAAWRFGGTDCRRCGSETDPIRRQSIGGVSLAILLDIVQIGSLFSVGDPVEVARRCSRCGHVRKLG